MKLKPPHAGACDPVTSEEVAATSTTASAFEETIVALRMADTVGE